MEWRWVVASGLVIVMASPGAALANACISNDPVSTVAFQFDSVNSSTGQYMEWANALRADLRGESPGLCFRVQSLIVYNEVIGGPLGNFVEIGWVIGYSPCDGSFQSSAFVFVSWKFALQDLESRCFGHGHKAVPGQWQRYTATDEDSSAIWSFYWKGVHLLNVAMNFTDGVAVANIAERKAQGDLGTGRIKALEYVRTSVWAPWTRLREYTAIPPNSYPKDVTHYCEALSDTDVRAVAVSPPAQCRLPDLNIQDDPPT